VLGPSDLLDRDSSEALAHAGAQLVFAHDRAALPGSERHALELVHHHPTRVRTVTANPPLLHRLVAAADLALFCHRYAPGGFSPLYCMPYGTVPITPRAGAFADAVVDYDQATGTGTGFLYAPHRPEDIPAATRRAVRAATSGEAWTELVERVAHADLSWRTAGLRHAELGREAIRASRELAPLSPR
jgi:starch synthase